MAAVCLAIYLPDLGHGFISDDFRWIVESRAESPDDLVSLFGRNLGFYRPVVALTFAADYAVWGATPFGFALTNLALLLMSAGLLFLLARRFGLPAAAALAGAGVWVFNFHAVNMALLWISGRTALVSSVFALTTALLFLGGRFAVAGVAALLAMLSKEEALALPALFTLFTWLTESGHATIRRTWPQWLAAGAYIGLRLQSGAFWPTNAPSFYAFTFSPAALARNVAEYADRAGTVAVGVGLLLLLLTRVRPSALAPNERRALIFAAVWIPAMFALTVLVPVRSSLYALLPSIGSALAVAVAASAALRANPRVFARAAAVLLLVVAALIPVYRSRNVRWVSLADLSAQTMATLQRETAGRPTGHIVLVDDLSQRFNLDSGFGSLFPEAVRLYLGPAWSGEVVARPDEAARPADLSFNLESDGAIRRR